MKVLASLVLLALVNYAYSTDVQSCQDLLLPEVTVTIDGTECTTGPCVVGLGSNYSILISFDTPVKLERIKAKSVSTGSDGVSVTVVFEDDTCDGIQNTVCPVAAGGHVDYLYASVLAEEYSELNATMVVTLLDVDNDDTAVLCFSVDLTIDNS
ncbi:uncharacterized protein LOC111692625 [Anoplophora glabripennis]|uniref:uncharacterized protein LOC108903202 n=1 Tax=Anoplophora glabripennis TaxID=217634 RepID=UPI000873FE9D|nr:uncharacterized protein LOC108903202 [Anoplophora glabripennis]XP_023312458.1 uncharacterized protein LOC111692625 [Anoplophora glabripennis]